MSEGSSTDLMLALTYRLGFTLPEMVKRMRMRECLGVDKGKRFGTNWIFELIGTCFRKGRGYFGTMGLGQGLKMKLTTYLKERKN